ncbi:MAG: SH3 domain-containing protein, partial [Hyphomicrobiales bacterium]
MTAGPDPRLHPWREDLAAAGLRGQVDAPRYAQGRARHVAAASAPLRRRPRADAPLETEALRGEAVTVYDEQEGWAWVQLGYDGYVGYMPAAALAEGAGNPTHRVTALRTYVFPTPDIKAPPADLLSLNALVEAAGTIGRFLKLSTGGYIAEGHAAPAAQYAGDFIAVAERFIGTPYLWGGRTSLGLDCSALVQLSL